MNTDAFKKLSIATKKTGLVLKKHSPEIMMTVGAIGTVVSAVMACKASTKIGSVVGDAKYNLDKIKEAETAGEFNGVEYTKDDAIRDKAVVIRDEVIDITKLYGPAVVLGIVSLGSMISSNRTLRKRNAELSIACAAAFKTFKEYRGRVVERFGEEVDKELRYNVRKEQVEEKVTDEKGKTKTVKKEIKVIDNDISEYSPYAKFYDDGCKGWTKDPEYNLSFLLRRQADATKRLREDGLLFLNDVYDMLGIPRTKDGQKVGWIYDENNPNCDNEVDFGIYNIDREANRNFVNGYERTILLDFNIDGNILDMEIPFMKKH